MRQIDNGLTKDVSMMRKRFKRSLLNSALTASGLIAMMSPALADNWVDHTGTGISVDTSTPNTTNITQTLDTVKIHGDGDINAGWTVNIAQPSSSSKYVLYDIENDPTEILGTLNANGRVYIFDQNGVIFGAGSQVNVGSIVTSTGFVSDENLAQDKLAFENVGGNGQIVNNGTINVAQAGLAAFVAPTVINNGVINAKLGTVAMASGDKVTLDFYGDKLVEIAVDGELENSLIENAGTIRAEGGTIAITAAAAKDAVDNVINMSGVADVSSVSVKGGKIILGGGNKGTVKVSGKLDASGTTGGDVKVTGQAVLLDTGSEIVADARENGDGGTIGAFGNSYAIMGGSASARGGSVSGDGGFIELSAHEAVGFSGLVDTSAAHGKTGTFLIDPQTINLGNFSLFDTGTLTNLKVDAQALANSLRLSNVHLWATNSIFTSANIDLSTWRGIIPSNRGITTNDLTLSANTININHNITLGEGDLILRDALTTDSIFGFGIVTPPSDINLATVNLNAQILARDVVAGATSVANLAAGQISGFAESVNVISPLALINQAIAFVQSAGTVNIAAGTYNESVYVDKAGITVNGANNGNNPNTTARGAETIINAQDWYGIYTDQNDVTIDGVSVQQSAADGYGIVGYNANNLTIRNNILTGGNFGIFNYGGTATNGLIENNKISDINGANGQAIHIRDNQYADIRGNDISDVNVGIATENFYAANPTGNRSEIDNNTISAKMIGIRNNLSYGTQTGFTISNNTITAEDPANARRWTGIDVISQQGGVETHFVNNDIDGSAVSATRLASGYELTNMTNANHAVIDGGSLENLDYGIWTTDGSFYTGAVTDLLIQNVSFNNMGNAAILAEDVWDAEDPLKSVNATGTKITIGAGNTFANTPYELAIAGENVTVNDNAVTTTLVKAAGSSTFVGAPSGYAGGQWEVKNASIQKGVNATKQAGTVTIEAGTFNEGNININKALLIEGSGKNQTILNAAGFNTGFTIDSNLGNRNVTLRRMSVNNATQDGVLVTETGNLKVLQLNQMAFNNNGYHGLAIYGNGPDEFRVLNSDFKDNGWGGGSSGEGDIMAFLYNGDVTLTNVTIQNNSPAGLADYGIQIRGSNTLASSGTIALDNVKIAGRYRAAPLGIQRFTDTDLSFNDVVLGGNTTGGTGSAGWGSLYLSNIGTTPIDLGNTSFSSVSGQYIENDSTANIDARDVSFEGVNGATATLDQNFAIEDKVRHALDVNGRGLVTWKDNHVFVTQASGSIQRGINASNVGGTVHVDDGTFTEQLVINKNLNLLGDGAHNTTIVNAPTVMVKSYTQDSRDNYAIMYVHDAATVNIDGIQFNGSTNTGNTYNNNARFVGVAYRNAGGNFTNNWVRDITTAGNASRSGFAFLATAKNTNSILNIDNNEFTGFQTYGIALADPKLTATVTNNTITGNKDTTSVVQSGIFVTENPKVTVGGADPLNANTISEVDYGVELFREHSGLYQNNDIFNVGRGFYVNASNYNDIFDNNINNATDTGIYIRSSIFNEVLGNKIRNSKDGIFATASDNTTIEKNILRSLTGNGISVSDSDDAIIKANRVNNVGGYGIQVSGSEDATVQKNTVFKTGGNGINILGSADAVILNNNVGAKAGIAQGVDNIKGDGIHVVGSDSARIQGNFVTETAAGTNGKGSGIYVENSDKVLIGGAGNKKNTISAAAWDGIKIEGGNGIEIRNNNVSDVERVGIYAAYARNLFIHNNVVDNTTFAIGSPYGGISTDWGSNIRVSGNTVTNSGQGVRMYNAGGSNSIVGNTIDSVTDNGIHVYDMAAGSSVRILRNSIGYGADGILGTADDTTIGANGIYISNAPDALVRRNSISNVGNNGIYASSLTNGSFIHNTVTGALNSGLYLAGPSNGYALVAGNVFRGNDIGATFESGTIDLTDPRANRFVNGRVGIRFAPYQIGGESTPIFASLNLVDDDAGVTSPYVEGVQPTNYGGTIGAQVFRNQSGNYIELANEAFYSPGNPTWINATNSRFISTADGYDITPSDFAGLILPADQISFLQGKLYHYPNGQAASPVENLGVFFFGAAPEIISPAGTLADINQSLIFNRFGAFNGDQTGLSVQIRGLPSLPGQGGTLASNLNNLNTFAGNPADLNNIETAAGGSDTQNPPQDLNEIETAAGETNEDCWGNAANDASGGQVVNIVYSGSFSDNMNAVAACGL